MSSGNIHHSPGSGPGAIRRNPPRGVRTSASDNTPKSTGNLQSQTVRKLAVTGRNPLSLQQSQVPGIERFPSSSPPPAYSASTPLVSPSAGALGPPGREGVITPAGFRNTLNDEVLLSGYQTTPIQHSAGVNLVSNLPNIPIIGNPSTIPELNIYLDAVAIHIDHYGTNLTNEPDWKKCIHPTYKHLLDFLYPAQIRAADINSQSLMTRCSDLMSRLEEFKMKWVLLTAGESSMSSFHGFPSSIQQENASVSRENASAIPDTSGLLRRIVVLEQLSTHVNRLSANYPKLGERIAVLENPDIALEQVNNQHQSFLEQIFSIESRVAVLENSQDTSLRQRVEALEQACNQHQLLSQDFSSRIVNLEAKLAQDFDLQELRSMCIENQASNRALTRQLTLFQASVNSDLDQVRNNVDDIFENHITVLQDHQAANNSHFAPIIPASLPQMPNVPQPSAPVSSLHDPVNLIYTTAPISSTGFMTHQRVASWLDSQIISSAPPGFAPVGMGLPGPIPACMGPPGFTPACIGPPGFTPACMGPPGFTPACIGPPFISGVPTPHLDQLNNQFIPHPNSGIPITSQYHANNQHQHFTVIIF
jgi:hypothetical protein